MRTAILGATGYIGESLARLWALEEPGPLSLFARRPEQLTGFPAAVDIQPIDVFDARDFDLVVSGIGAGDPASVDSLGAAILDITKIWDDRVIDRLRPDAHYVFLSSGVVHAAEPWPPYTQSKIDAEAAHRALTGLSVLDLRVFAYAESNIKLDGAFFLAELARCAIQGLPFRTTRADMARDYAGAPELRDLIKAWLGAGGPNCALDLYTLAPVTKLALLDMAQKDLGVTVEWIDSVQAAPTGHKPAYVSTQHAAEALGYRPQRTAMQITRAMLENLIRR